MHDDLFPLPKCSTFLRSAERLRSAVRTLMSTLWHACVTQRVKKRWLHLTVANCVGSRTARMNDGGQEVVFCKRTHFSIFNRARHACTYRVNRQRQSLRVFLNRFSTTTAMTSVQGNQTKHLFSFQCVSLSITICFLTVLFFSSFFKLSSLYFKFFH
jgi:hypothetical protein